MKIRTMIAAAMSVALLTVFVAAPVSAGGPASWKVGARGVEFGLEAIATNCPLNNTDMSSLKAMGAAGKITTQQSSQSPCLVVGGPAPVRALPKTRAGVDPATKLAARAEAAAKPAIIWGDDYYIIETFTAGSVWGQAGSGYDYTGLGVTPPITGLLYIAWIYNGATYDLWEGVSYEDADMLVVAEDLAGGAASTWIPGLGQLNVVCVAGGAWFRGAETLTGGLDPNDGWTYELTQRGRFCDLGLGVSINGTGLPLNEGMLTRTVFTTVDVWPW
jgi:hypothetical protein